MIFYVQLKQKIEKAFDDYLTEIFKVDGQKCLYFYWNLDFLENEYNLNFEFFSLSQIEREQINDLGKDYFGDGDLVFEVNTNTQRYNLHIKNINQLFTGEEKSGQVVKYDFIREFVFWDILRKNSDDNKNFLCLEKKQRGNFIFSYIEYLKTQNVSLLNPFFIDYYPLVKTESGKKLIGKIKELEKKGYDNNRLIKKINELYILKKEAKKIHFVFSIVGGEEKEELRQLLDLMGRKEAGKFYRGQACASWKLNASITREPKYLDHEAEMYYEILSIKPDAFLNDRSVYERLITMQHFGMPTRLLDITRNPLVAIFFACNNQQEMDKDGVVFTFSPHKNEFLNFEDDRLNRLSELYSNPIDNSRSNGAEDFLEKVWFIKGVAKNARISNQSGDFIFVGKGDDISRKLHDLPSFYIIIDAPTKKVLLEQLDSLNIHGGSVYPDLGHISNYIGQKYKRKSEPLIDLVDEEVGSSNSSKSLEDYFQELLKNPPEISEEKRRRYEEQFNNIIRKSPPQKPTNNINMDEFWSEGVLNQVDKFANDENLNASLLKSIIEDYLFTGKVPLRDNVDRAMHQKLRLKERYKIDELINKIVHFVDELKKNFL